MLISDNEIIQLFRPFVGLDFNKDHFDTIISVVQDHFNITKTHTSSADFNLPGSLCVNTVRNHIIKSATIISLNNHYPATFCKVENENELFRDFISLIIVFRNNNKRIYPDECNVIKGFINYVYGSQFRYNFKMSNITDFASYNSSDIKMIVQILKDNDYNVYHVDTDEIISESHIDESIKQLIYDNIKQMYNGLKAVTFDDYDNPIIFGENVKQIIFCGNDFTFKSRGYRLSKPHKNCVDTVITKINSYQQTHGLSYVY